VYSVACPNGLGWLIEWSTPGIVTVDTSFEVSREAVDGAKTRIRGFIAVHDYSDVLGLMPVVSGHDILWMCSLTNGDLHAEMYEAAMDSLPGG
jgi:hypothetical protein